MSYNEIQKDKLSNEVLAAAIEVHRHLGPGLLESSYLKCMCHEMSLRRIPFSVEMQIPVTYKAVRLESGFRADLIVNDELIVELKTVSGIDPIHKAQLLTYLRISGLKRGLLINFNVEVLKQGIHRVVNSYHP